MQSDSAAYLLSSRRQPTVHAIEAFKVGNITLLHRSLSPAARFARKEPRYELTAFDKVQLFQQVASQRRVFE
jgi:hypothetical protein